MISHKWKYAGMSDYQDRVTFINNTHIYICERCGFKLNIPKSISLANVLNGILDVKFNDCDLMIIMKVQNS